MGSYVVYSALTTKLASWGRVCISPDLSAPCQSTHDPGPVLVPRALYQARRDSRNRSEQTFPDPDTFPSWNHLTSDRHRPQSLFGLRYVAADAWEVRRDSAGGEERPRCHTGCRRTAA